MLRNEVKWSGYTMKDFVVPENEKKSGRNVGNRGKWNQKLFKFFR